MPINITLISDTHLVFNDVNSLPGGDILIHAGDVSKRGRIDEIYEFLTFFESIPNYKHKVFIAGNHDFRFEDDPNSIMELLNRFPNLNYLENKLIEIEGIKIWGSPIQPWFHDWAFNRTRGDQIKKYWDMIPADIDILVTHGPPFGILDRTRTGERVGCEDLLESLKRIKPKIHVFGHIHEGYGTIERDDVLFVNASVLNLSYQATQNPITVEYDPINKIILDYGMHIAS